MKPFCIAPWVSITQTADNRVKPCCVYKGSIGEKGISIQDAWEHSEMISLRRNLIKNKPPKECNNCNLRKETIDRNRAQWYEEKLEINIDDYELVPPMDLKHLDLNFGNKCNLKCRMCGSWGSSQWFKEDKMLQDLNPNFNRSESDLIIHQASDFTELKDSLQNLQIVYFKGGEPMLQEGMFEFLQYLIDWDYAKNIKISYTTNGTVYDERIEKLWPHFKEVYMVLSLDGTGDLYQYIRGGEHHTLDSVIENMKKFNQFKNFEGSFNVAVQIYNLFALPEILDLITNINLDHFSTYYRFDCMVTIPTYLDINILPKYIKNRALNKLKKCDHPALEPIIKALKNNISKTEELDLFVQFTKELDKIRKTDIKKIIPQLGDLFG